MDLEIRKFDRPLPIEWNYDELRDAIAERVREYESIVYTDDNIKTAKADKAQLNKLKRALNDERIRREREYMQPFDVFKAQIREICDLLDKPIHQIDQRVKEYEDRLKAEKEAQIRAIFDETPKPDWVTWESVFERRWLNATEPIRLITTELRGKIELREKEYRMLGTLPEFSFEAQEEYKRTLDVNRAIQEGARLADIAKRKAAAEAAAAAAEAAKQTPVPPHGQQIEQTPEPIRAADEEERRWVQIRAHLTVGQARDLKRFFVYNGIQYEVIKERS